MGIWVSLKTSLYSLIATEQSILKLGEGGNAIVITEAVWTEIESDFPKLNPDLVSVLQTLRQQEKIQSLEPTRGSAQAIYQRFGGQLSLRLCILCALADATNGTLLIDSVPDIHALKSVSVYPYTTGITVARDWLTNGSNTLSADRYVEQAARMMMVTPSHPEAKWWFSHLQLCN